MRILFMGTPDFAVLPLKALFTSPYHIIGVITQPDKPNRRGKKISFSPVKTMAIENEIEVYQPENIKSPEAIEKVRSFCADVIVAVAYGQLLPKEIIEMPKYGCINIHASLLPKYRGSAPIHWSIINGDEETGVTTMHMDIGMDTGDIIYQEKIKIEDHMTTGDLYDTLATMGADLIIKTLEDLKSGEAPRVRQDEDLVSYAPPLSKDTGKIHWNKSSLEIANLIRGTNPWPVAYTHYGQSKLKIYTYTHYHEGEDYDLVPGTIIKHEKNKGLLVKTGDGAIYLNSIQFPNKKRMEIDEYLKGHTIHFGEEFK